MSEQRAVGMTAIVGDGSYRLEPLRAIVETNLRLQLGHRWGDANLDHFEYRWEDFEEPQILWDPVTDEPVRDEDGEFVADESAPPHHFWRLSVEARYTPPSMKEEATRG